MGSFVPSSGTENDARCHLSSEQRVSIPVAENRFHARQAAAALLKMAKSTSDPKVAAGLVDVAADLKDQAGELPPPVTDAEANTPPDAKPS
jgi:hypothetical protein